MKKLITIGTCFAALFAALLPPASAWEPGDGEFNIRHDPNEGTTVLDIAEVWTHYGPHRTLFGVKSWYHFRSGDLRIPTTSRGKSFYDFRIDTYGSHRIDRTIAFFKYSRGARDRLWCEVDTWNGGNRGWHPAVKEPRAIYCAVRTNRLKIEKTPRFFVWAVDRSSYEDRAPDGDTSRYVGL